MQETTVRLICCTINICSVAKRSLLKIIFSTHFLTLKIELHIHTSYKVLSYSGEILTTRLKTK